MCIRFQFILFLYLSEASFLKSSFGVLPPQKFLHWTEDLHLPLRDNREPVLPASILCHTVRGPHNSELPLLESCGWHLKHPLFCFLFHWHQMKREVPFLSYTIIAKYGFESYPSGHPKFHNIRLFLPL